MTTIDELKKLPMLLGRKQVEVATGLSRHVVDSLFSGQVVHHSPKGKRFYSRDLLIAVLQGDATKPRKSSSKK